MTLFAAFRTVENSCLLFFAILLIIPAVIAAWGWLRYPQVAHLSAAVFGAFVVLAALPLMFWIQSSLILLAVAAFLVAPLIVAIKAWRRGPPGNEFSGVVAAVLAALVVLTLDLLAAEERWHIAKVKLYWLPDTFGFFICSLIGYLALIPIYLGLSLALFSEIAEVRKQQRLATITPTNDVYSDL